MKLLVWLVGTLALLLGGVEPARAGLIVNGGFETGDFTGWTSNGVRDLVVAQDGANGIPSHSGTYYANFGTARADGIGVISQTINDTAGTSYTLNMYLYGDSIGNEFEVEWNGATLYDMSDISGHSYRLLSFTVQGTGSDTLTLSGWDNQVALAVDDVSLNPTASPEPCSLALLGMGGLGLAGYGWRRRRLSATA